MYPREPDQTYGATVNSWMRDNISAADAYAPAFTVSANDPSRFSSNKIFACTTDSSSRHGQRFGIRFSNTHGEWFACDAISRSNASLLSSGGSFAPHASGKISA